MSVIIIIPAFNEEESILGTVNDLKVQDIDFLVVNDGSKDSTPDLLDREHIPHIDLPLNLGIGGAVQTGYRYALRHGYDYAIQLDADGQHNPEDLRHLITGIQERNVDMLIGSRFVEKTSYRGSTSRRLGIRFFTSLLRVVSRIHIADPTSGYRIVNRQVIRLFAEDYPVDYPEVEVLARLAKKGFKVEEIPVEMNDRQGGVSSINFKRSIYYMLKVTLLSVIRSVF